MFVTMHLSRAEKTTFQLLWEDRAVPRHFRSGVSLHSHSMYSEEPLESLMRYVSRVATLSNAFGRHIDFERTFWTPPLSPRRAYCVEEKQIHRELNLPALISLTDHDSIQAGMLLHVMERYREAPISVEWTVPFGSTFFHIGVHNIPADDATNILDYLESYTTAAPDIRSLQDRLSFLNDRRDILLVLNHPFWDEKGIGCEQHTRELHHLLSIAHPYMHALELNGLRGWAENGKVMRLVEEAGLPALSGGDRHGCEPNAILNLSEASTFPEFVEDVRRRRTSHVVFMPQYRQPLNWRTTRTVIDVLRDYPSSFAGRRLWTERVFCRMPDGTPVSLASLFSEGRVPPVFRMVSSGVRLIQFPGMPVILRLLMSVGDTGWRSRDLGVEAAAPN